VSSNHAWAEYNVKKWSQIIAVELPAHIADEQAAQVFVNGLTAYAMLLAEPTAKPGDWYIQSAAGSALGRILAQLAKIKVCHCHFRAFGSPTHNVFLRPRV